MKKIFESKKFRYAITALGGVIIFLSVFGLGVFVGFKKADFNHRWNENYVHNFGGPMGGFSGRGFGGQPPFMDAHGTSGSIIKTDGNVLTIKGVDNTEKLVLVSDNTSIRKETQNLKVGDLKVDDNVTVIGSPNNQGQIEAKLIRVFNK